MTWRPPVPRPGGLHPHQTQELVVNAAFAAVDRTSDVPLNEQVRTAITKAIRDKELRPGAKLPAPAELAAAFGVDNSTIYVAMRKLTTAGLVERVSPGGLWVSLDQRDY